MLLLTAVPQIVSMLQAVWPEHSFMLDMDIRSHCKGQHQSLYSLPDEWSYKVFSTNVPCDSLDSLEAMTKILWKAYFYMKVTDQLTQNKTG